MDQEMKERIEKLKTEYGYCRCGCGKKTNIIKMTNLARGLVKNSPRRYIAGHYSTSRRPGYTIKENGCWEWNGRTNKDGYCGIQIDGKYVGAHRYMYEKIVEKIGRGLVLDHLCRVPSCVNPSHLEPVTHAENCRRGVATKLNRKTVEIIRAKLENKKRGDTEKIARRFNVCRQTIANIESNYTWKTI